MPGELAVALAASTQTAASQLNCAFRTPTTARGIATYDLVRTRKTVLSLPLGPLCANLTKGRNGFHYSRYLGITMLCYAKRGFWEKASARSCMFWVLLTRNMSNAAIPMQGHATQSGIIRKGMKVALQLDRCLMTYRLG